MKRLLVRIAALVTVVALGLIAIAQAQRGSGDPAPQALESTSTSSETTAPKVVVELPVTKPVHALTQPTGPVPKKPEPTVLSNPFSHRGVESPSTSPEGASEPVKPLLLASAGDGSGPPTPGQYPNLQRRPAPVGAPRRFRADPHAAPVGAPQRIPPPGTQNRSNPIRGDVIPSAASMGNYPPPKAASAAPSDGRVQPALLSREGFPRSTPPSPLAKSPPIEEGTGQPGSEQLEGPQCPHLTIEKSAPDEIQVGKPALFRTTVRNTGSVTAADVVLRDLLPKGTQLVSTTPRTSSDARGELVWELGTMKPDDETTVEMKVMPVAEGDIGSVATVTFNAQASVRCRCTKPELTLKTTAPDRVLIGEELTLSITITNPGTGVATGVVIEEHVPVGLQHPAGGDLEYEIGDLPPGQSRKLELSMIASRPGQLTNVLTARGEGNLHVENRLNLEVVAPKLDVAVAGPKRRYLEREATYRLSVTNPGTAAAEKVELAAYLPRGLKFVSANNAGHYDEAQRAVFWRLEELPVNESGTVELVTMPVEAGDQSIRLRSTAEKGITVEKKQPVLIEGIAAIMFQVADATDPIEVGGETTYEVRIVNQGSKAATNVKLVVVLPPQLRPLAADGPSQNQVEGNRVVFDDLARLAPKADTTYRVRAQALQPGDLRTRFQLLTNEMQSPVTKEESTRVFSDE